MQASYKYGAFKALESYRLWSKKFEEIMLGYLVISPSTRTMDFKEKAEWLFIYPLPPVDGCLREILKA